VLLPGGRYQVQLQGKLQGEIQAEVPSACVVRNEWELYAGLIRGVIRDLAWRSMSGSH